MIIINILILIKYCNSSLLLLLLLLIILIIIYYDSYVKRRMIPLLCLISLKMLVNVLLAILHYWNNIIVAFTYSCYVIKIEAINNDNLKTSLNVLLQPYKEAVRKYSKILQCYLLGEKTRPEFDSLRECLKYLFANVRASITYDYDTEMESPHAQHFISLTDPYRNPCYKFLFVIVKLKQYFITIVNLSLVSKWLTLLIICYLTYFIIKFLKKAIREYKKMPISNKHDKNDKE